MKREVALLAYVMLVELMLTIPEVLLHLAIHPYAESIAAMLSVIMTDTAVHVYCHCMWIFVCTVLVNVSA